MAKQGYTNLVLVQHTKSRNPGDSKDMVRARTRFLSTGLYEPLSNAVNAMVQRVLSLTNNSSTNTNNRDVSIIDAGCGEGYYTRRLEQSLRKMKMPLKQATNTRMAAFDISKCAVRTAAAAAKAANTNRPSSIISATRTSTTTTSIDSNISNISNKNNSTNIQWFVANSMDLPVPAASCDVLMSLFAPLSATEFSRILRPNTGHLVVASAGADHLIELRRLLYDNDIKEEKIIVDDHDEVYPLNKLLPMFSLVSEEIVRFRIQLDNTNDYTTDYTINNTINNNNNNNNNNSNNENHTNHHHTVLDLLGMTPYQWRSSLKQQAILSSPHLTKEQLNFTVHVRLQAFQKRS